MISLQLIDTGAFLELPENINLNIKLVNPAFSKEVGHNSQSLSWNIPLTDHNRKELGFYDSSIIRNPPTGFDVMIWVEGFPMLYGNMKLGTVTNSGQSISVRWEGDVSPFVGSLTTLLRDIDLGGERTISSSTVPTVIHSDMIAHANAVYAANISDYDYTFAPVFAENWYPGESDWKGYINYFDWDAQSFLPNADISGNRWHNSLVPFPRVRYLIDRVTSHLGLTDQTDWSLFPDVDGLCLFNTQTLDGSSDPETWNYGVTSMNLRDHVPQAWTLADLIVYFRDFFNAAFLPNYQNMTVEWVPRKDLIRQSGIDFTDRSLNSHTLDRIDPSERGYLYTYNDDNKDLGYETLRNGGVLADLKVDAAATTITCLAAPLAFFQSDTHPDGSGDFWTVSRYDGQGISVRDGNDEVEGSPRTIMYRGSSTGFQLAGSTSNGKSYPLAFSGRVDARNATFGSYSLFWGASIAPNMYEQWWEPWLDGRLEMATIEQPVMMSLPDILSFKWMEPARQRLPEAEAIVAIISIDLSFTRMGLQPATITGLRI